MSAFRKIENIGDVALVETSVFRKEFKTVSVPWKMACGNHHRTVRQVIGENGTHEHRGGRGKTAVEYTDPVKKESFAETV